MPSPLRERKKEDEEEEEEEGEEEEEEERRGQCNASRARGPWLLGSGCWPGQAAVGP